MPGDDRLRFDQDQGLGPARPEVVQRHPEDPIVSPQLRPWLFSFEHRQLLQESNILQGKPVTREEKGVQVSEGSQKRDHPFDGNHESTPILPHTP